MNGVGARESEYINNYLPITNSNSISPMIYTRDSNYEARPSAADSNGRDSGGKSLFYYQTDEG